METTEKAEARAKVQLALMKKLAGTTWGTDTVTLTRLYTGRVKPELEYDMTAWGMHDSQAQLWSGQQTTEPGSPHHHRGHEINADSGAGNNHGAPVT